MMVMRSILAAVVAQSVAVADHLAQLSEWEAMHPVTSTPPTTRVSAGSSAGLNFSHAYGDSMILQRAPHAASIWGWAAPGAKVTVAIEGSSATGAAIASAECFASPAGSWRVSLPPQPASTTPVKISAKAGPDTIEISDVLFGDVYVCE
jgi:hypothetical protein